MTTESAKRALDRVANPQRTPSTAILHAVGLDPANPQHQAALLVCEKYGLDPLMKQVHVFAGNTYITRDGWMAIAHRSGQLDGVVITYEEPDNTHYRAQASVYRKDMTHPFTYRGRYPIKGRTGRGTEFGPEMAVKCAEVMALKRAFPVDIPDVGAWEERFDLHESEPEDEADQAWVAQAQSAAEPESEE